MRRMLLIAVSILLPGAAAASQAAIEKTPKAPTHAAAPTAEPENAQGYAPPVAHEQEGPSAADVGPVQKRFVRASALDNPTAVQSGDNASIEMPESLALDKRISVPLIHDVQNDGSFRSAQNEALRFELQYINWGAVTQEQLSARQGHYFTITWANDGPKADFTAVFQYRQVKSQEIVRTLTQSMPNVSGAVRSYFAVVDKAYLAYGPVSGWRFTIRKGDTIVAETKSFIW